MPRVLEPTLVRLGYQNKPAVTFGEHKQYDGPCATLPGLTNMLTGPNSGALLSGVLGGAKGSAPKGSAPKGASPKGT
jgi:hypothetical protein